LADLAAAETGVLESLELPHELAHRLMLLGFIPGISVEAAHSAPGGDPRIYRVDGSEVALRHATAASLILRNGESHDSSREG
jgi:Fe2+ transport system protein FeoA